MDLEGYNSIKDFPVKHCKGARNKDEYEDMILTKHKLSYCFMLVPEQS